MFASLHARIKQDAAEFRDGWRALALAIALGLAGGLTFAHFHFPLPWVLGPMTLATIVSIAGVRVWIPRWLQGPMTMILGLFFGTTIAPDLVDRMIEWLPSVSAVVVFVVVTTGVSMLYLVRVAKADKVSAYFSSAPGGVIPMTAMGAHYGGDMRFVALAQSMRLIASVVVVPVTFALFAGYHPTGNAGTGAPMSSIGLIDVPILIAMAAGGWGAAKVCRIPAPDLVGPLIVMGVLHATGGFTAPIPDSLVAFAQLTTGARLGAAFFRLNLRTFGRQLFHATSVALLMLVMGVVFAFVVAPFSALPMTALFLAYAPGGIAEMSIIAYGLGIEVVFVVTHQIIRFVFVVALVPAAVWVFKMKPKEGAT